MSIDKVVVSILLGDGHVSKRGTIRIKHSIVQKEYLEFKCNVLEQHGFKTRIYEREELSYGVLRKFIVADGYASSDSKKLRNILYPEGVKVVPVSYVEYFDFQDWSFIFMDDGRANCLSHTNNLINGVRTRKDTVKFTNRYEICTESFTKEDNNLLVGNLCSLGIDSYISNRNRIIISKAESKISFYEGVKPFIVPSMRYKIETIPSLSYKSQ